MKALKWLSCCLVVGFVMALTGCPPGNTASSPKTTGPVEEEHVSIKEAKKNDDGSTLAPGESREVTTPNGIVIVSKDKDGKVTYKRK